MPSSRLLAACNKQVQDKHYSYIAWRFRLSEEKLDEIQASRPRKIARLDDCIFDEVPSRDISDSGCPKCFWFTFSICLHLPFACWRSAILLLSALTTSFSLSWPFKSLRPSQVYAVPTSLRCNPLIKRLGNSICDLTNKGLSMDDSLHEIVQVRCILQTLCNHVCLFTAQEATWGSGSPAVIDRPHPKGKGGKGKGRGGKSKDRGDASGPKWMVTFYDNGQQKQMCKRWNLRSGCKLDDCFFHSWLCS